MRLNAGQLNSSVLNGTRGGSASITVSAAAVLQATATRTATAAAVLQTSFTVATTASAILAVTSVQIATTSAVLQATVSKPSTATAVLLGVAQVAVAVDAQISLTSGTVPCSIFFFG